MNKTKIHDVAIIGGGLAGLTLACLLGQARVETVCIDQAPAGATSNDLRTTAVSYGSRQILERAGIWGKVAESACPIDDIRILDGGSSLLLNFLSAEVEDKSFGWIVLNSDLRGAMISVIKTLPSVSHLLAAKVKDFARSENHMNVILENGDTLRARLVIGADGRHSFTREWMGVHLREWSYRQQAIISTVLHEQPHHNTAVEHFWPEGPFAILPMADGPDGEHRSAVVFTEHQKPGKGSFMDLDDAAFEQELASRFPPEYGTVAMLGKRAAYPLGLVHAAEYIAPRMALVADAAHGIHPIAGQGLNLGFRDVAELSNLLAEAHQAGKDPGDQTLLESYQRRRRPDNTAMIAVTDGLNRLFSNNIIPIRLLRRAGLKAVSRLPIAKRFFMRQAMGDL